MVRLLLAFVVSVLVLGFAPPVQANGTPTVCHNCGSTAPQLAPREDLRGKPVRRLVRGAGNAIRFTLKGRCRG